MSGIIKSALRIPALKTAGKFLGSKHGMGIRKLETTRSMWNFSSQRPEIFHHDCNNLGICQCKCGNRGIHNRGGNFLSKAAAEVDEGKDSNNTRGEKELADFLVEEISAERKLQKSKKVPSEIDGFKVQIDGAEVTLIKKSGDETIEVNWNINHTVDTEVTEPEVDPSMDKPDLGEMKSRPTFEVEIKRGGSTLGFTCSSVSPSSQQEQQQDDAYNDIFMIDEVVIYEGDWKDSIYSVSGEVLDGTLYDLYMNLLEDKGISNEFVEKLVDFSTAVEHDSYIKMLEDVRRFVVPK